MKPHFDFSACSTLRLAEDGIYYAIGSEAISYPEEGMRLVSRSKTSRFGFGIGMIELSKLRGIFCKSI
jgi:hypothetical protein